LSYLFKILLLFFAAITLYSQNIQLKFLSSFGEFKDASGMTKDQYNNFYIADIGANRLFKYSDKQVLVAGAGGYGWNNNSFDAPQDIASSFDLYLYVCDFNNNRLQHLDKDFNYISSIKNLEGSTKKEEFGYPKSIALTSDGEIFFLDSENKRIVKLDAFRNFIRDFGGIGYGEGELTEPSKIRCDNRNNLFVIDGKKLFKFDPFGNFLSVIELDVMISGISFYKNLYVLLSMESIRFIDPNTMNETAYLFKDILPENGTISSGFSPKDILVFENTLYLLSKNVLLEFQINN